MNRFAMDGVAMERYEVFEGIELLFLDVHRESIQFHSEKKTRTFAINHCEEGRIECKFNSGDYLYMGPGDMSLGWHVHNDYHHQNYFPTQYFKGVILLVDVEKAQRVLNKEVKELNINVEELANRFCENSEFGMLIEETEAVRTIFSSLYYVSNAIRINYYRLKVIEIFLLLSVISTESSKKRIPFRKHHVETVKTIHRYITKHYDKKLTIESLAAQFDMPTSTLKRVFKGIFDMTIHDCIIECRMNEAKRLLKHTDKPILHIANAVGYENGSKFTATFKDLVGIKPSEYRYEN